jgi:hypothetical protein
MEGISLVTIVEFQLEMVFGKKKNNVITVSRSSFQARAQAWRLNGESDLSEPNRFWPILGGKMQRNRWNRSRALNMSL